MVAKADIKPEDTADVMEQIVQQRAPPIMKGFFEAVRVQQLPRADVHQGRHAL
jgi:predicted kinase